jgi:hypothetical protein
MSQTCPRCYRIVSRACQSDTETYDCPELARAQQQVLPRKRRPQGSEWIDNKGKRHRHYAGAKLADRPNDPK